MYLWISANLSRRRFGHSSNWKRAMPDTLTEEAKERILESLKVCSNFQGEYIPGDHGPGSWATTYSNEFIEASAAIYLELKNAGFAFPIAKLAFLFQKANIRSCRGSVMHIDRVQYLFDTHLRHHIRNLEQRQQT